MKLTNELPFSSTTTTTTGIKKMMKFSVNTKLFFLNRLILYHEIKI